MRLVRALAVVSVLSMMTLGVCGAFAQDIAGNWQGEVSGADSQRIVIKITKRDTGKLEATITRLTS
jgi:hypothetical protein